MPSITPTIPKHRLHNLKTRLCGLVIALSGAAGCHEFPDVFVDELPDSDMVTTTSVEHARLANVTPVQRKRDFAVVRVEPQDGTVAHGPLWFADPLEMKGSNDGQFAVTAEDFYAFPIGIARFVANLAFWPISMMTTRPDSVMCSDGIPRRSTRAGAPEPFDAEPCSGTTIPPDVHEVWIFDESAHHDTENTTTDSRTGDG